MTVPGISRWKILLSYFKDVPIHTFSSSVNGTMKLALCNGELKLSGHKAVYSFGKKYASFGHVFDRLKIHSNLDCKRVLVLGWGMGSIADLLSKHPEIKEMIGIEHDAVLTNFYSDHLNDQYPFKIKLVNDDAFDYLSNVSQKYDLICSDIFMDNITPDRLISGKFISDLHHCLNPGGIAIISKLNRTPKDAEQNGILEGYLQSVTGTANSFKTMGNNMYWWKKRE